VVATDAETLGRGRHRARHVTPRQPAGARAVLRVVCHAVTELPFVVVALVQSAQGWRPTQDDAAIAIRSWAVLTAHSPLLGQISQASGCTGGNASSPGPLQYWLLAIPVRLDHVHGVLWGAALAAAVAMAICVEAGWSLRGPGGAALVAAGGVVLLSTETSILVNPIWNPYLGVVWFAAALLTAWVVASGRLYWWPLLVVCASIAAQNHLEYALPSAVLALAAPAAGVARVSPRRFGWLPGGVLAGAACWAAPLAQQVTGNPGNLTVLLRCTGSPGSMGGAFGLRALGSTVTPLPLWFHHPPTSSVHAVMSAIGQGSAAAGVLTLAGLCAVAVTAWVTGRTELAALAGVAFVAAISTVWVMGAVPSAKRAELAYLDVILWPVGMLVWAVAGWALLEVVRVAARSKQRSRWARSLGRSLRHAGVPWVAAAALLGAGLANTVVVGTAAGADAVQLAGGPGTFRGVVAAAMAIDRAMPRGPLMLGVTAPDRFASYALLYGTAWVLISEGRQATVPQPFRDPITPPAYRVGGEPRLTVTVGGDGSVERVVVMRPGAAGA
jgi:hypothetical protein